MNRSSVSMLKDLMAEDESPVVARRRVPLALREARKKVVYTQTEVAEEMEWSLSKVFRIDNGDVGIPPNDLRPLSVDARLGLHNVDDDVVLYRESGFRDGICEGVAMRRGHRGRFRTSGMMPATRETPNPARPEKRNLFYEL